MTASRWRTLPWVLTLLPAAVVLLAAVPVAGATTSANGTLVVSSGLPAAAKIVIGSRAYPLGRYGSTRISLPAGHRGLVVASGSSVVGKSVTVGRNAVTVLTVSPGAHLGVSTTPLSGLTVGAGQARIIFADVASDGSASVAINGSVVRRHLTPGSVRSLTVAAGAVQVEVPSGVSTPSGPAKTVRLSSGGQVLVTLHGRPGGLGLTSTGLPGLPGLTVAPATPSTAACGVLARGDIDVTVTGSCDTLTLQGSDQHVHVTGSVGRLETQGSDETVTVDGAVTTGVLSGADDTVTVAGLITDLQLPGSNDTVTAGQLGTVEASGSHDTAVWHNGPAPTVSDVGQHNAVSQG